MARSYVTLSPDLVEYADAAADFLEGEGYRVSVEPSDLYYPNTPTLVGKKRSTEFVVEVATGSAAARFDDWVHYGRARNKETFVALVLPEVATVPASELAKLRALGVGVCSASQDGVSVLVEAVDLSMAIGLPDLSREPRALQRLLKPPFKKMSDGSVVDGFKDAAAAFEGLARSNLARGVASGRIKCVSDAGKLRAMSAQKIGRMTLGQLGAAYGEIVAPTQVDDLARRAIQSILKDRNDATHSSVSPSVVRRVKRNAPKHAFAILNGMRGLL